MNLKQTFHLDSPTNLMTFQINQDMFGMERDEEKGVEENVIEIY